MYERRREREQGREGGSEVFENYLIFHRRRRMVGKIWEERERDKGAVAAGKKPGAAGPKGWCSRAF